MATPNVPLTYRVVVRGIKPEHSVDQAVDALTRLVKNPPPVLRLMLDGRKVVFLRTTDRQRAAAYKRTLDTIGCVCSVETELPPPLPTPEGDQAFTVNFATAAIKPASGPEFQFAQPPSVWKILLKYLRANRVTLGIAFVLLLYVGYKYFLSLG